MANKNVDGGDDGSLKNKRRRCGEQRSLRPLPPAHDALVIEDAKRCRGLGGGGGEGVDEAADYLVDWMNRGMPTDLVPPVYTYPRAPPPPPPPPSMPLPLPLPLPPPTLSLLVGAPPRQEVEEVDESTSSSVATGSSASESEATKRAVSRDVAIDIAMTMLTAVETKEDAEAKGTYLDVLRKALVAVTSELQLTNECRVEFNPGAARGDCVRITLVGVKKAKTAIKDVEKINSRAFKTKLASRLGGCHVREIGGIDEIRPRCRCLAGCDKRCAKHDPSPGGFRRHCSACLNCPTLTRNMFLDKEFVFERFLRGDGVDAEQGCEASRAADARQKSSPVRRDAHGKFSTEGGS